MMKVLREEKYEEVEDHASQGCACALSMRWVGDTSNLDDSTVIETEAVELEDGSTLIQTVEVQVETEEVMVQTEEVVPVDTPIPDPMTLSRVTLDEVIDIRCKIILKTNKNLREYIS